MNYHRRTPVVMVFLCGLLFQSCEEDFSPKAPFEQKLVVFSLLTAAQDTQYVLISRTYDVEGFDPFRNRLSPDVSDAEVKVIRDDGMTIFFQDTTIQLDSNERYGEEGVAYYAAGFRILPRRLYRLEVQSPAYGRVTASFGTPDAVRIGHSIDHETDDLLVTAISRGAKGFLIRLFVVYKLTSDKIAVEKALEVPISITNDGERIFPQVDRLNARRFRRDLIAAVLGDALRSASSGTVEDIGRRVVVWALDPNAYNYYQIVRGFNDPFSVRVDEPDYTNIEGGLGVFGGLLVDSLFVRTQ
ncbi:MAG: DUF4249 family protein [Bacteroidota bacterium]